MQGEVLGLWALKNKKKQMLFKWSELSSDKNKYKSSKTSKVKLTKIC